MLLDVPLDLKTNPFKLVNPTAYKNSETGLQSLVSNLLGAATIVAGLGFLIYFVVGGIQWITAGGDKAGLESAKGKIMHGLIGLVIVVFAWVIVAIVQAVLGLDILNFKFPGAPTP